MTETKTVFGIPLEGEEPYFNRNTKAWQRPLEELQPMFEDVLRHDDVMAIRWRQYTPYFNDGEVCEFGVYAGDSYGFVQLQSLIDAGEENDKMGGFFFDADDERIKGGHREVFKRLDGTEDPNRVRHLHSGYGYVRITDEPLPTHPAYHDIKKLQDAIGSGAFYDALYRTFGDHVTVTIMRDKIELETYEHE